jgi:hypothetical protein
VSILFLRVADSGSTNSVSFSSVLHNKPFRRDAVIRVYDEAGNVIEPHDHKASLRRRKCSPRETKAAMR